MMEENTEGYHALHKQYWAPFVGIWRRLLRYRSCGRLNNGGKGDVFHIDETRLNRTDTEDWHRQQQLPSTLVARHIRSDECFSISDDFAALAIRLQFSLHLVGRLVDNKYPRPLSTTGSLPLTLTEDHKMLLESDINSCCLQLDSSWSIPHIITALACCRYRDRNNTKQSWGMLPESCSECNIPAFSAVLLGSFRQVQWSLRQNVIQPHLSDTLPRRHSLHDRPMGTQDYIVELIITNSPHNLSM